MGGTIVFNMLIAYGGSRDRTPNAENMQAAIEHALGKVDFTKGRRLQLGESVEEPIKFVDVEKLEGEASINVGGVMSTYSDTFQVTIGGFGPLLQRISNLVRTFDFLKSCADKLRADGRTSVAFSNNAYTAARVEGKGWVSDADGNPIPNVDPSEDGTTFLYRPEIEYAQFNATVLPPTDPGGGGGLGGPLDAGPASQTIGDDEVAGGVIFAIIFVFILILTPVLCYYYARTKYGADKAGTWFCYKISHSNPALPLLYKPQEELDRIRKLLSTPVDDTQGKQLSVLDDTQDMGSHQTAV